MGYNGASATASLVPSIKDTVSYQDLDSQLRTGVDLIQDAYTRQAAILKHENAHYKHIAAQHKEQSSTLNAQVTTLSRRVAELERALSIQASEKKALIASKGALLDRYNSVKKSASQLEAFRKSIVSMVEYSPAAQPHLSLDLDIRQTGIDYAHTPSKSDMNQGKPGFSNIHHLTNDIHQVTSEPEIPNDNLRHSQGTNSSNSAFGKHASESQNTLGASTGSRGYHAGKPEDSGVSSGGSAGLGGSTGHQQHTFDDRPAPLQGNNGYTTDDYERHLKTVATNAGTRYHTHQASDNLNEYGPPLVESNDDHLTISANTGQDTTSYFDHNNTLRSIDISTQALDYSLASMTTHDKSGLKSVDVLAQGKSHPNPPHHQNHLFHQRFSNNLEGLDTANGESTEVAETRSAEVHPKNKSPPGTNKMLGLLSSLSVTRPSQEIIDPSRSTRGPALVSSGSVLDTVSANPNSTATESAIRTTHFRSNSPTNNTYRKGADPAPVASHHAQVDMDAPTLYRHIRDILTPASFELFATAVAAFNSGRVSASDTVAQVHRIVGSGELSRQMSRLIYDAMRENTGGGDSDVA
ncbi:hypothetical protein BASA50_006706 [Batrachochytrium salamandrivorans]|uniref:Uncharacterized protein n=1 Tax=Batrachochytrium salamandrivorans TaxID=1357716 RepID=A0ABQ8FCD1_9FUNG|nr:hypothetical protein BASA50_006706 [Batrachochytrium salamandrivorans]KAH9253254.1 hypothetical protein BASA81_008765 [Batrachochytrium salamandrivorans]KAH9274920.1 hypothetical protein BASA83_002632 [Batrachochytrium salamandrivorans]